MEGALGSIATMWGKQQDLSQILLTGTMVMFRVLPMIYLTPFLGGKLVPPTTKMGLSFVMAIVLWPHATAGMIGPMHFNALVYIVMMFKELFIGFTIGFVASELFYAMEVGGRILDVMRGSNMAEVQVPALGFRASPVGAFMFNLLLITFLAVGGHRIFILAMAESYSVVPVDAWPQMSHGFFSFVDQIMRFTGNLFMIAFALTFPGIFATFMTDVTFGMLNRVAPQLNAYIMAMGVKAMGALVMLFFSLGLVWTRLTELVADSLSFLQGMIQLYG